MSTRASSGVVPSTRVITVSMPSGVEHAAAFGASAALDDVITVSMPSGVEHRKTAGGYRKITP